MPTFPTLSRSPQVSGLQNGLFGDPTIRTELSSGYLQTGNRVSWIPKTFVRKYTGLTNADKALLVTFQETTVEVGKTNFDWTDVVSTNTYDVVLMSPITFTMVTPGIWSCTIKLRQFTSTVT